MIENIFQQNHPFPSSLMNNCTPKKKKIKNLPLSTKPPLLFTLLSHHSPALTTDRPQREWMVPRIHHHDFALMPLKTISPASIETGAWALNRGRRKLLMMPYGQSIRQPQEADWMSAANNAS